MFEFAKALPDLNAAIEGGIVDARAYAARGVSSAAGGSASEGVKDLQKAVELDPLNAPYRYQLSQLMRGRTSSGGFSSGFVSFSSGGDSEKDINNPEAKIQAGLARELAPENEEFRRWYQRFE